MLDLAQRPERPLVAASILSADFGHMIDDCRDVLGQGADLLHIDVMDGHFVSNLTMGQDMIRGVRKHLPETLLDVHLMVECPGDYVDSFAAAGASLFNFHLEVCSPFHPNGIDGEALIERVKAAGMKVGMTINPYTPAQPLEPYLDRLDLVLVMSVVPGRSGQKFMPEVLPKVRWLRERLPETTRLEMDGGISPATVGQAVEAGADTLVTASALFGVPETERAAVIQALQRGGAT